MQHVYIIMNRHMFAQFSGSEEKADLGGLLFSYMHIFSDVCKSLVVVTHFDHKIMVYNYHNQSEFSLSYLNGLYNSILFTLATENPGNGANTNVHSLVSHLSETDATNEQSSNGPHFSEIEKRILQRQIHQDSEDIIEEFASLRISAENHLLEKQCTVKKLLTCIMDVKHIKTASKELPMSELKDAKCISDAFLVLIERNLISFLHFSIIKRVITQLCSDSKELQEDLKSYEAKFSKYIRRRVFECSMYHEGRFEVFSGPLSKNTVQLLIVTDENWDEYTPFVKVLNLEKIVASSLNFSRFVLHLERIEPQCLKLFYALSVKIAKSLLPLTPEEWRQLSQHGIVELKCLGFQYKKQENCK